MIPTLDMVREMFRYGAWCDRCAEKPRLYVEEMPGFGQRRIVAKHHGATEAHVINDELFLLDSDKIGRALRAQLMFFWRGFFSYPRRPKPKRARRAPLYAQRRARVRARRYP